MTPDLFPDLTSSPPPRRQRLRRELDALIDTVKTRCRWYPKALENETPHHKTADDWLEAVSCGQVTDLAIQETREALRVYHGCRADQVEILTQILNTRSALAKEEARALEVSMTRAQAAFHS